MITVQTEIAEKVACICCGSEKYATQSPYLCHNCWKNGEAAKLIQQLTQRGGNPREEVMEHLRFSKSAEIPLKDTHVCTKCGRRLRRFIINGQSRYMTDDGKRHYRYCNMPPNTASTRLGAGVESESQNDVAPSG